MKKSEDTRVPVTLLSGFLGSGKSTLLEHILRSKKSSLRCAVIVNDMAELNIDASLLSSHNVIKKEEKLVTMQNGCICCTLREDLVKEIVNLVKEGKCEYIVIESTGISEPQQVAETFTAEFHDHAFENQDSSTSSTENEMSSELVEILKAGGLAKVARLDTCVTVVDCLSFFSTFQTPEFLAEKYENVDEQDDRTISSLMIDQLEFADVIILNKRDLVSASSLASIHSLIKKLNPVAKVIESTYGRIKVRDILNTNAFDFEKAATSAGWLRSLNEPVQPESEEYGVSSFVYRARRPFHPERLWNVIDEKFCLQQLTNLQAVEVDEEGEEGDNESNQSEDEEDENEGDEMEEDEDEEAEKRKRVDAKLACPIFGPVLRSKGFVWLANQPNVYGELSQAGCMMTLNPGSPWFCTMSREDWPEEAVALIEKDFADGVGDRRQEIVFIGIDMQRDKIFKTLDECLLTDKEWKRYQFLMKKIETADEDKQMEYMEKFFDEFPSPFEEWPEVDEDEQEEEEDKPGK